MPGTFSITGKLRGVLDIGATRAEWKTEPLPEQRARIDLDLPFTRQEMATIKRGFIPKEMEDKWFIFFEDNTLFCHRSWTGYCVYEVYFERRTATHALVNRDPEQYSATDDGRNRQLILHLIKLLLLGQPSSYPPRPDLDPRDKTLEQGSFMGQAMLSGDEVEGDQEPAEADRDDYPSK
jgi:8-oxo-dGTP diphosphatase